MKVFNLPDLGEGLPDAEIVEWLVNEGDPVELDQPMVSMETAKAVVEVPSPYAGRIVKFHGRAGDVIQTGAPLCEFEVEGEAATDSQAPAPAETAEPAATASSPGDHDDWSADTSSGAEEASDEGETAAESAEPETFVSEPAPAEAPPEPAAPAAAPEPTSSTEEREDTGTVVGNVQSSNEVLSERTSSVGGVKVTPAVRAMARKLKVDIARVRPSGADGVVTVRDVREAADRGTAPVEARVAAAPEQVPTARPEQPARTQETARQESATAASPAPAAASGEWEPVRGPRRTMVRVMSEAHRQVVPTTLMDDADIHAWRPGEDITARLLRALWAGAKAEPGLNAWFDGEKSMRIVHKQMHVGMAVDTADGLFVAALRNVDQADHQQLRHEINRLRENTANRSIPPEDLKDYTIVLSNFGKFAGRYATPVVTPPCVSIVAAGALRHEVVPVLGGIEVHRVIPISLTFDHRACTGGEAARFLKAMLEDLAQAE
ncbi:MAG: 2-oxo acid dehydrogenase subunit E2 [Wenzhouxiangella sp.]|nr:MAG: 2-oxo acid dehydrogenase subunit E2 [Wenzhouxiangella sp.]